MIKPLRKHNPLANIVAIDYDPGASEVNQLNRIKLMMATAHKNLEKKLVREKSRMKPQKLLHRDGAGREKTALSL